MKMHFGPALTVAMVVALQSSALALDTSGPLLCYLSEAHQCDASVPCSQTTPATINLPDFVVIDHKKQEVRMLGASHSDRKTAIKRSEIVKGNLIVQGAESSDESDREAVGWTAAIDDESGQLVVTATDGGSAIVVFGKCVEAPK